MSKIAILKNVLFESKTTFESLSDENILINFKDKIDFVEIKGTLDIYIQLKQVFGNLSDIEISNCDYNLTSLLQSFSTEDNNNIVLVKRKLHDNDTYTFLEFNPNEPENDKYQYENIDIEDCINLYRSKSILKGIYVEHDGTKKEQEFIILKNTEDVGKILLKNSEKELVYLNISNLINEHQNIEEEKLNEIIKEKMNAYCAEYIYTQITMGLFVLNFYCQSFSHHKNDILSNMTGNDIYGNVLIFLQNNTNNDNDRILPMNMNFFDKLYTAIKNKRQIKMSNEYFFNIFKEFN